MSNWVGTSPSGDSGPTSFFQEDFSNILQEQGLNDFVNMLGLADHTHFNSFHSFYADHDGSCNSTVHVHHNSDNTGGTEPKAVCDEQPACTSADADYLHSIPSPYGEVETPKQSRGASPDRLDCAGGQHLETPTPTSKRRRDSDSDRAEDDLASCKTAHGTDMSWKALIFLCLTLQILIICSLTGGIEQANPHLTILSVPQALGR